MKIIVTVENSQEDISGWTKGQQKEAAIDT